jgi:transposase
MDDSHADIGYCYGIRSERRLCDEVSVNEVSVKLSYRWFCRLGLKDKVPDHSSFSKIAVVASEATTRFATYLTPYCGAV